MAVTRLASPAEPSGATASGAGNLPSRFAATPPPPDAAIDEAADKGATPMAVEDWQGEAAAAGAEGEAAKQQQQPTATQTPQDGPAEAEAEAAAEAASKPAPEV